MLGFAQKVLIADTLAPMVDAGHAIAHPTTADVLLSVTGYTLRASISTSPATAPWPSASA